MTSLSATLPRATLECRLTRYGSAVILLVALVGCGGQGDQPSLGSVQGVVTLDGVPLSGVAVTFASKGFRHSRGFTDAVGHYELTYLRDIKGAVVGEHQVHIVVVPGNGASVDSLPAKYGAKTELIANVERGSNHFDWALESVR